MCLRERKRGHCTINMQHLLYALSGWRQKLHTQTNIEKRHEMTIWRVLLINQQYFIEAANKVIFLFSLNSMRDVGLSKLH